MEKFQPARVNELARSAYRTYLDLNGTWDFELVPARSGEKENWQAGGKSFTDTINVPGSLEAQGKGLEYAPLSSPGWGQSCDVPYNGVAWYRKSFQSPELKPGQRAWLNFGGVAVLSKIWLNGTLLGSHRHATVPFQFEVTGLIKAGATNDLTVQIENPNNNTAQDFLVNAFHGLGATTTELGWSGIYRGVELVITNQATLRDVYIVPDIETGQVECQYEINSSAGLTNCSLRVKVSSWSEMKGEVSAAEAAANQEGRVELQVKSPRLWSDTDPFLYRLEIELVGEDGTVQDSLVERFGFRKIRFDGSHILLNEKPVFLRGDMVHFHWPVTVSPTTDRDDLRQKLGMYKCYGFNFLRHHTHFPGVEYLEVCDELGLLSSNELGLLMGLMPGVRVRNDGALKWAVAPDDALPMWEALIKRDRNHPAVIIWCMGNESAPEKELMREMGKLTRKVDNTRLIQSDSPGYYIEEDGSLLAAPVHHELRRAGASYIDTSLKPLYRGALRPWRMQFAEQTTAQAGLAEYLPLFTQNTQSLQAQVRKIVLENVRLRNPEYKDYNSSVNGSALDWQGYQLCTFRDSGSFVWGVVDDFFQPKKVQPEQLKQYNNATVLLWNTPWQERLYTYGDRITLTFKCSYYEPNPLQEASLAWELVDSDGHKFDGGEVNGVQVNCGELKAIDVDYSFLPKTGPAQKLRLVARLAAGGQTITQNQWDLWVYPAGNMQNYPNKVFISELGSAPELLLRQRYPFIEPLRISKLAPEDLLITGKINPVLLDHLAQGGKALLSARYNLPSMFTEWSSSRSEFPRGTVIFEHPLFKNFPQEGWCDIPFAGMISNSVEPEIHRNSEGQVTLLSGWPGELKPIIMGIPSYKDAKPPKLAHLFEVKVGRGRLMVTSLDFSSPKAQNPATNYFFDQLLGYLAGPDFNPQTGVEAEFLRGFSENAPYEPLKAGSGIKLLQPNPKKTA